MKHYLATAVTGVVIVVLMSAVFLSTKHLWAMQSGVEIACPPANPLEYCLIEQENGALGTTVSTFSPSSDIFVSGADRNVIFWDAASGDRVLQKVMTSGNIRTVAYTPDGSALVASAGTLIQMFDVADGHIIRAIFGHEDIITRTSISPDAKWLAASDERELRVWNLEDGTLIHTLLTGRINVRDLNFSPDNQRLVVGRRGADAEVYDVANGSLLFTLPEDHVFGARYTQDGNEIITAGYSDQIKRWRADDGSFIGVLGGHDMNILAIGMSSDGQKLASGARDGVKVWDLTTNKLIVTLQNVDLVSSISFSKDDQYLIVSGMNEQLKIWRLP